MDFFSNIKISHKLSALMVGLTLGFILIGVAYFVQVSIENNIQKSNSELFEYQILVEKANSLQKHMRELSQRFVLSNSIEVVNELKKTRSILDDYVAQIKTQGVNYSIGDEVNKLDLLLKQYDSKLEFFEKNIKSVGLSEKFRLQEQMRNNAYEMEAILSKYDMKESLVSYLQLLRHEKDYFTKPGGEYLEKVRIEYLNLKKLVGGYKLSSSVKSNLLELGGGYITAFNEIVVSNVSVEDVNFELIKIGEALDEKFEGIVDGSQVYAKKYVEDSAEKSNTIKAVFSILLFLVAVVTAVGMFFVYKSISFPLLHIQRVIRNVNAGDIKSRVGLKTSDELGDLGEAFNKLLDEKIQSLNEQSKENERLNSSIIGLIKALGIIAKKDLTIKLPVSSDITGTISDAVNLLTTETAKTLQQVKDICEKVDSISDMLNAQSEAVGSVAQEERTHVIEASRALEHSAKTMTTIASEAESANEFAQHAIETTLRALGTVTETVSGIKVIRETISETEKRIKRLGERSHEITGIVNLINSIAERTHILALNASMHAASAGEAGKGFAVVAEEVQRLAENAREATSDISSMVNNIRVETSDTVTTMNRLISEVADGTKLAEKAGEQMSETEVSTRRLVDTVRSISEGSTNQAKFTHAIRKRATAIRRITDQTGMKLAEQRRYTENLKRFSQHLVERVNVFTLPAAVAQPFTADPLIKSSSSVTGSLADTVAPDKISHSPVRRNPGDMDRVVQNETLSPVEAVDDPVAESFVSESQEDQALPTH